MAEKILYVTNTGDEVLSDFWDGKPYDFPCGETIAVPEYVAVQLFGYGEHDRTKQIARLGWSKTKTDMPQALAKLDKFSITRNPPQKKKAA